MTLEIQDLIARLKDKLDKAKAEQGGDFIIVAKKFIKELETEEFEENGDV